MQILAAVSAQTTDVIVQTGIGLGSVIAVVCSWQRNRSIVWAIGAGILSWLYVICRHPHSGREEVIGAFDILQAGQCFMHGAGRLRSPCLEEQQSSSEREFGNEPPR